VQIPEKSNLKCLLLEGGGNITINTKIEGDVTCRTSDGNIIVEKLRGHDIYLHAESTNLIFASGLLEGQDIHVQTRGRFRGKQLHGSNIQIITQQDDEDDDEKKVSSVRDTEDVDDEKSLVDISSMFVSGTGGATVDVHGNGTSLGRRAVRIKSHHGPVKVTAYSFCKPKETNPLTSKPYPLVELGGVNGSCEVCIDFTDTSSINYDDADDDSNINDEVRNWTSCLVHVDSLAQDTVSLVTADQGCINLTFDRKVEADLRLITVPDVDNVVTAGSIVADGDDAKSVVQELRRSLPETAEMGPMKGAEQISVQTKAFTPREGASFTEGYANYVDGWIENTSSEPDSRFEQKVRGDAAGGKIRLEAASEQALHGFAHQNKTRGAKSSAEYLRPLFAAAGTNQINVETVSWLGAIARRYGLEEIKRDAGRTASRRDLKPRE
jgi:hypothetical protein